VIVSYNCGDTIYDRRSTLKLYKTLLNFNQNVPSKALIIRDHITTGFFKSRPVFLSFLWLRNLDALKKLLNQIIPNLTNNT
jgi:hypothetical protein